ncbi:glycoside hydrolase [Vibrio fluvialis]|uniref:glycoside hydrolase n=1 Tax=Vibrio fluvialis TaxID=676 RepID=UPI00192B042F|nr:glycoside hydrolase [Vibrio fluvialis]
MTHPLLSWAPLSLMALTLSVHAVPVTLNSDQQQIQISPDNLAILWNGIHVNSAGLSVNQQPQQASNIEVTSARSARWQLRPSQINVSATLDRDGLQLSFAPAAHPRITRNHPVTLRWFDLPQRDTDALLLPFSEGMRIPTDNRTWGDFLIDNYSGANTTQDLKMPFWTAQQGANFVSVQLLSATNNTLTFSQADERLDMQADHQFTALNQHDPFQVRLSLGKQALDGAKAYRQWRKQHQQSTPLQQQVARNPAISRLIGASQVYLFGQGLLSTQDVRDWWGLNDWYLDASTLSVDPASRKELQDLKARRDGFSRYHQQLLIDALNNSLAARFAASPPTLSDNAIAAQFDAAQKQKRWLASAAARYLSAPERWGQALTSEMVNILQSAGLTQLWLGFDNWMPAFFQPDAVEQAKKVGYLVATYDSYNTAIPLGVNDSWLTAQLPGEMREQCAIERASGEKQLGFRGQGNYLNPNCHLAYVQQRVLDIVRYGHFNSLFLDVDATAMAREDYRDATSENAMLRAFNQRMLWISEQQGLVLGSEDGNSLTTQGISFAHGLETVGFGWQDNEMKRDTRSPYFLGRWYPNHKPDFFFKSAAVKEPYKTLLFNPQYRVPLYQTVFHDEVINSHHWHSDSLKFSNVQAERDLTSMLYNTPPMVHLTRDEALSPSSPRIKALKHYQQGFSPIHQQLWNQALTGFQWLDDVGQLQQTTFSDGSTIIANFSPHSRNHHGVTIKAQSVLATLSDGKQIHWTAMPNR